MRVVRIRKIVMAFTSSAATKQIQLGLFLIVSLVGGQLHADEIDELQGKWKLEFVQNGRNLHAIKTIDGHTETVETYFGDKLIHRHVVAIEIVPMDEYYILKWGVAEVTDGPEKGSARTPGSLICKRNGNIWYNVVGLRNDEDFPVGVQKFVRVEIES